MANQAAVAVEALLGVNAKAGNTRLCLADAIMSGLPVSALDRLASAVAPGDARFKFRLISKVTLDRRQKAAARQLSGDEGNRLVRLAKFYVFALAIYRDSGNVRGFLNRPHAMLDGERPLNVALATDPGTDAVINLLGGTTYGGGA